MVLSHIVIASNIVLSQIVTASNSVES